jgi:hypothetical protein
MAKTKEPTFNPEKDAAIVTKKGRKVLAQDGNYFSYAERNVRGEWKTTPKCIPVAEVVKDDVLQQQEEIKKLLLSLVKRTEDLSKTIETNFKGE